MVERAAIAQKALGLHKKLGLFLESIKFEHTVFALPFAYLTLFLVEDGLPGLGNFLWITVAMVGARTFAMGCNRIIDAAIDAQNPRTKTRALASGRLAAPEAWLFSFIVLGVFLVAVYQLSPWAQRLWPPVVAMMALYPYGKRFTWLCHLGLASVYLMVPPGVWVAVQNEISLASVLLGIGAAFWVASFDVLYACQDLGHDRAHSLHSIPARFGLAPGLLAARLMHLLTVAFLAAAGPFLDAGALYYAGIAVAAGLLAYEHSLVSPRDLSKLNVAFFNMNGIISVVLFTFVSIDTVI